MAMHITVDTLLERVKAMAPCSGRTLQRQKHQAEDAAVTADEHSPAHTCDTLGGWRRGTP